jgi:hypothetical protein
LGGLAKTSTGYIFTGTYGYSANRSRNVFILTFDDNLSACSAPLWLTDYAPTTGHAAHPKITALDAGRYMVVWELCEFSTQSAQQVPSGNQTGYKSTYMLIIDERGKVLTPAKELPGPRLNMNDTLRYNRTNGKVYWSVNDGKQAVLTYTFDPNQAITIKPDASSSAAPFTVVVQDEYLLKAKVEGQGASRSITITKYTGAMTKRASESNLVIPATIIGMPVTVIDADAFQFTQLASLTLPANIRFEKNAFRQIKLPSLVIPSGVSVIGSGAFTYADIGNITLSAGVTVIEAQAFWYSSITTMVIPSGVTSIGDQAFSNCSKLTSITLPATAVNIGSYAFSGCKNLTTIVIPPAITQVGYAAFKGCDNLAPAVRSELQRRFGDRAF